MVAQLTKKNDHRVEQDVAANDVQGVFRTKGPTDDGAFDITIKGGDGSSVIEHHRFFIRMHNLRFWHDATKV